MTVGIDGGAAEGYLLLNCYKEEFLTRRGVS